MKRIEFIAPVAAMRGNLSGNQTLLYPSRDNSAFDAPADKVNYARNYTPRFIGAKRAKDGHTYFAVKTKSAVNTTAATMLAMAAMGAANAYYGCLIKDLSFKSRVDAIYASYPAGTWKSLREFIYARGLYDMFKQKNISFNLIGAPGTGLVLTLDNPFVAQASAEAIPAGFPADLLVKFWTYLAKDEQGLEPIKFTVAGYGTGLAFNGMDIGYIEGKFYNILNIIDHGEACGIGRREDSVWLQFDGAYVENTHKMADGQVFTTTNQAPA